MDGISLLFPFPYWIYVDETSPPTTQEITVDRSRLRYYPPFRSGSTDMVGGTPVAVDIEDVPFRPGHRPNNDYEIIPAVIAIPDFSGTPPTPTTDQDHRRLSWLRMDIVSRDDEPRRIAGETTKRLMELLRWKTGQWWITRSNAALSRPQYLEFPISESGRPSRSGNRFSGTCRTQTLFGTEAELDDDIWKDALASLETGIEVPIHELLFLEAQYFRAAGDFRQAVLEADSACENLKEIVFARLWKRNNPGKDFDEDRRDKTLRNWNLPKHLDETFRNHFGRSYKEEYPGRWESVKDLWLARNNVAHGGKNEYGTPPVPVDGETCGKFLNATRHCLNWLEVQLAD